MKINPLIRKFSDAPHVDDVLICIKSHRGGPEKAALGTCGFRYAVCGCHFAIAGLETRKGCR